jgi:hypothetical protein
MSDDDNESAAELLAPRASRAPVDRASESVVSPRDYRDGKAAAPVPIGPISSGQIEIPPESRTLPPPEAVSIVPPSTIAANAMDRGRSMLPLSTIVGIGAGIFVVLVVLSLLLFR